MSEVIQITDGESEEPMEVDNLNKSADKGTNEDESEADTSSPPKNNMASTSTEKPKQRKKLTVGVCIFGFQCFL